ncbi:SGNH/GDSL hydrolase family protein [Phycicoccus sp. Root563]|uniref:SGNH/GDSL hydrolase family protein n=1 Tax=Phycicoccus sp. Root563 TaxID=1736562 RepID=UPI0009E9D49D|nr:SGNH/GDSL hydrolase family protein [Phycicoccus sp. Root563]
MTSAPVPRRRRRHAVAAAALASVVLLAGIASVGGLTRAASADAPTDGSSRSLVAVSPKPSRGEVPQEEGATPAAIPSAARVRWVGTWATAVAVPQAGEALAGFTDVTLRQRVQVSLGGDVVRLRLTNVHGTSPLSVSATLARPATRHRALRGDLDPTTLVPVTFGGSRHVVIPAGSATTSDPVAIVVPDDGDLLVSLHLPGPTGPATYHPQAHSTGYVGHGDQTASASVAAFPGRTTSFWFLDGLDVRATASGSVVFLGDSITDGAASTLDADHRWPDRLADRVLAEPRPLRFGVLNAGISGNRLLLDAHGQGQGERALGRFTRDVLTRSGVETVVVLEGVNDIQQDPSETDPQDLVAAYREILVRAHERHVRVVVATIGPFRGWPRWTPECEAVRVAVNEWIRGSGEPDAVLDLDAALRDPVQPTRLVAAYDSGDHLHPNDLGYAAMAAAVDLPELLGQPR